MVWAFHAGHGPALPARSEWSIVPESATYRARSPIGATTGDFRSGSVEGGRQATTEGDAERPRRVRADGGYSRSGDPATRASRLVPRGSARSREPASQGGAKRGQRRRGEAALDQLRLNSATLNRAAEL